MSVNTKLLDSIVGCVNVGVLRVHGGFTNTVPTYSFSFLLEYYASGHWIVEIKGSEIMTYQTPSIYFAMYSLVKFICLYLQSSRALLVSFLMMSMLHFLTLLEIEDSFCAHNTRDAFTVGVHFSRLFIST